MCVINAHSQTSINRANKELELHNFELASKSFEEIISNEPGDVNILSQLASSEFHLNKMESAIQNYEQALSIGTLKPDHVLKYAKALQAMQQYDKAKKWFLNYAEANPTEGLQYAESCDFAQQMTSLNTMYDVRSEYINTPSAEFGPTFFKDYVVFASSREGGNNKLYISSRDNNKYLTKPAALRSSMKNASNEGPLSYSEDGKMVVYTKNNFTESTRQIPSAGISMSIYFATANEKGDWTGDQPFKYNDSGYSSGYPFLADNGNTLYFASDRPDGFGGFDLYVSYRIGNDWSVPENLGNAVNTSGNEICPFIEKSTLYFSSDFHKGLGGYDIFKGEKAGTEGWTKVFHLGNELNSSYDDYSFIINSDKNIGYFCSNRPGKGNEDLYSVVKITDNFTITVLDEQNNPVQDAIVDLRNCKEKEFRTTASGKVSFQALKDFNCQAIITKPGYETVAFNLRSTGSSKVQALELVMKRGTVDAAYMGRVMDGATRMPKESVYVRAVSQTNGTIEESVSNSNGEYFLELKPDSKYVISYIENGNVNTTQTVETGNGGNRSILKEVNLTAGQGQPMASSPVVSSQPPPVVTASGTPPAQPSTTPPASTTTVVTPSPAPAVSNPIPTGAAVEGYSVQIAAVSASSNVDMNQFAKTSYTDRIYQKTEKGKTKIRVGVFPTYVEADEARKELVKKGYDRAFIVKDMLMPKPSETIAATTPPVSAPQPAVTPTPKPAPQPTTPVVTSPTPTTVVTPPTKTTAPISTTGQYLVRLASYKNPKYFDPSKVNHFGTIEKRKSGEFTVMLISSFTTIIDAEKAARFAREAGFNGAHVVVDVNGDLKKVK